MANTIIHSQPALGSMSDTTLAVHGSFLGNTVFEELACRRTGSGTYILCCIPFACPDLAMGDEFTVASREGRLHVADVTARSGHSTFFVTVSSKTANGLSSVLKALQEVGCRWEVHADIFVAIDVAESISEQDCWDVLLQEYHAGRLGDIQALYSFSTAHSRLIVQHPHATWSGRANAIAYARISDEQAYWEQIHVESRDNRLIVCCIPFFIYHMALGDEVVAEVILPSTPPFVPNHLKHIVKHSPNYTFRVYAQHGDLIDRIGREMLSLGCDIEIYANRMIAVNASEGIKAEVQNALNALEDNEEITYEGTEIKSNNHIDYRRLPMETQRRANILD